MSFKVLAYITCKTWNKLTSCPNTLNWMISKTLINLGCLSLPLSGYIHKSFAFHNSNIHFPAFHLTTSGNSIHFCWNVPQGICTKILIIFLRWFQAPNIYIPWVGKRIRGSLHAGIQIKCAGSSHGVFIFSLSLLVSPDMYMYTWGNI